MAVVAYKCPNCAGPLEFKAEGQNWKCEYCLSEFNEKEVMEFSGNQNLNDEIEKDAAPDLNIEPDANFIEQAKAYSCSSCGAEIVTDETTAATFCYYCHNPTILPSKLSGEYQPAKVIPFQFNKDKAKEVFRNWCKKKPLLPKFFTSDSELEKLSGIYVPFWLFDCNVTGTLAANGTRVRTWRAGNMQYTETKYYRLNRAGRAQYEGVPADGSKKMDDALMSVLEPYDYSKMREFSMSYLSGYLAEKYDLDKDQVYGGVSTRVKGYMNSMLRDTVRGYSSVRVENSKYGIDKSEATYVLLPVWMFTYNFKGKTYIYAMNGQTGKIAGHLPVDRKRTAGWFGAVSGLSFVALLIGGLFL